MAQLAITSLVKIMINMIRKTVFYSSNLSYAHNFNYGLITGHLKPILLNDTTILNCIIFLSGLTFLFLNVFNFKSNFWVINQSRPVSVKRVFTIRKVWKKKFSSIFFLLKVKPIFCIFGNYEFYNSFSFHTAESSSKKLLMKYSI